MPQQDESAPNVRRRRGKRDKEIAVPTKRPKRQSKALQKHKNDTPSGGIEVMLPSFIGLAILACGAMAKMGFRGRPSVAGIDLGTTNSVICVQAQSTGHEQIVIDCIADPASGSAVIPSVVSFLEPHEWSVGPSSKRTSELSPHPSHVVVGAAAKQRIDSHPHHTLYHAKRVIGRSLEDPSIRVLQSEVEFGMEPHNKDDSVEFTVPSLQVRVSPTQVGAYVVDHLSRIVANALGHENVKSAIICVPAKFNARQRQATVEAFRTAGMTVTRILEEPTAAALAYGLHRKEGVDYILVYDFGGGTLDLSLLHVSDGFVDVLGSDGDDVLGGSNFDDAIAQYLIEYHHNEAVNTVARVLQQYQWDEDALSNQCPILAEHPLCSVSSFHTIGEQFKIQLSEQYGTSDQLEVTSQCMALPSNLADDADVSTIESFCNALQPLDLSLTLDTFERIVQPLFDRALAPIPRLLDAYDMTSADIDEIVMVGGTTRMPHIRQLVQTALDGSTMNTSIDPDLTVAYGAASVID